MSEPSIVKVAIDSALPQLDRFFDYLIPQNLQGHLQPGMRVVVPFGKAKKPTQGFAIELCSQSETAQLSEVSSLVSEAIVLTKEILELCRTVAERQACTLHDVLKLAVPARSVRVENAWLVEEHPVIDGLESYHFEGEKLVDAKRVAFSPIPWMLGDYPGWIHQFVSTAVANLQKHKSTVIVVPDYRDQSALLELLEQLNLLSHTVHYGNDVTPSAKYHAFLSALSGPRVIIGSRSAIFAPATELGSILLYNDGDSSLIEPTSPYLATREIALIRQQLTDCQLIIASQSRSCEVQRLVEMHYLTEIAATELKPIIAATESESRVDSLAFQTIRRALEAGGSALVQVSTSGTTSSLFCTKCSDRSTCRVCNGPIGLDSKQQPKCRWCNAFNLNLSCNNCAGTSFRQGRAGVTRTVAEFGKSFPGISVVEASGAKPLLRLKAGKRIVVATVGAEPLVSGGYDCVVLLDAQNLLARDTLKATENAIRQWSEAISLLKPGSKAVLVGVPNRLGQQLALWNLKRLAAEELAQRRALGFPPHCRLATVTAEKTLAAAVVQDLRFDGKFFEVLGPLPVGDQDRYILRFEYSIGAEVAQELRARTFAVGAGLTKVNSAGRASRAIRLKLDDAEVV